MKESQALQNAFFQAMNVRKKNDTERKNYKISFVAGGIDRRCKIFWLLRSILFSRDAQELIDEL